MADEGGVPCRRFAQLMQSNMMPGVVPILFTAGCRRAIPRSDSQRCLPSGISAARNDSGQGEVLNPCSRGQRPRKVVSNEHLALKGQAKFQGGAWLALSGRRHSSAGTEGVALGYDGCSLSGWCACEGLPKRFLRRAIFGRASIPASHGRSKTAGKNKARQEPRPPGSPHVSGENKIPYS
jgi:hypothetical protein